MRIALHDRVVDLGDGCIEPGGQLTQFECNLVRYLRLRAGVVVTRDALLVDVWGYPKPVVTRAVDSAIRRLRRKIEAQPQAPRHLMTVQGEGYRWLEACADTLMEEAERRCAGRVAWAEQLAWAEATFGVPLDVHDSRVGLAPEIAATYRAQTVHLPAPANRLLGLLAQSTVGWTPTELAQESDLAAVRELVAGKWAVLDDGCVRLDPVWWPVRPRTGELAAEAVALWTARFAAGEPVYLDDLPTGLLPGVPLASQIELLIASRRARLNAGRNRELVTQYDAVLKRVADPAVRCRLMVERANALRGIGLTQDAHADLEAAAAWARQAGATELLGRAAALQATLAHTVAAWSRAEVLYGEAAALLREDTDLRAICLAEQATVLVVNGRPQEGARAARQALAFATRSASADSVGLAAHAVAETLLALGRTEEAAERLELLYDDPLLKRQRPRSASTRAMAALDLADLEGASLWVRRALEHSTEGGEAPLHAIATRLLGVLHAMRGNWSAALASFMRSLALIEDANMTGRTLTLRCWIAVCHAVADRRPEALATLKRARSDVGASPPTIQALLALAAELFDLPRVRVDEGQIASPDYRLAQRVWIPALQRADPSQDCHGQLL
jgi:tetratricopeptide (TPR) repeat protein